MWTIKSSHLGLSKTSFFRIRGSDNGDDPCGAQKSSTEQEHLLLFLFKSYATTLHKMHL